MARKRKKSRRRKTRRSQGAPLMRMLGDIGVFCITLMIGLAALFAYFARDLPDTRTLWRDTGAPKITLLAADGSPILIHGASAGAPVRLADLPSHVPNAILAVEDRNFYHHFGVNPVSVLRALIVNAKEGEIRQGGSTITQQLAKNIFLNADRTIKRKIQELLLAAWLEQKFTKHEILTLYLNRVYFGAGAYGVDAASHRYFGKQARFLSVGEAAVLAGLLKAPSRFAPTSHPIDAGRRGRLVIEQMVAAGFLPRDEADQIIAHPIQLATPRFSAAPFFADYALRQARARLNGVDADLIVHTTFEPEMQSAAELGFVAGLASTPDNLDGVEAAAVIVDKEGAVRAVIGGRDYQKSQFNRAVQAQRQPGSAFKPFVYLAAINSGSGEGEIVLDAPIRINKWAPDNYNSKYYGEITLREALARSLNSAAIRVQEKVGRKAVRNTARSMGWRGALTSGPSLALGVDAVSPLNLAAAYAPFANGGLRIEPYVIDRIETTDGDLVFKRAGPIVGEAAPPQAIAEMNDMMRSVVDWGTGRAAAIPGYRAAGKTGTSQDSRDAWFAGHAGGLVAVVWVGRDDNGPMPGVTGGRAPAVIWREVMVRTLETQRPSPAFARQDPIAALLELGG